jgi:hypothetical protein
MISQFIPLQWWNDPARHSIATGVALTLACLLGYYLWPAQVLWILLGSFIVAQTSRSAMFAQSIWSITLAASAVLLAYALPYFCNIYLVIILNAILIVLTGLFYAAKQPISSKKTYFILLFPFIFLAAQSFLLESTTELRDRIFALGAGGLLALIVGQLLVPARFFEYFRADLLPILKVLKAYSDQISGVFSQHADGVLTVQLTQVTIDNILQAQDMYPEWVFEFGFNPGLRASYRYFLLQLERIIDLYTAMGYLLRSESLRSQLCDINKEICLVLENNSKLLQIIIQYFTNAQVTGVQDDFTSDMIALEEAVRHIVPSHLDLLDISPNYLLLASFVRDTKDIRQLLLQLILAFAKK